MRNERGRRGLNLVGLQFSTTATWTGHRTRILMMKRSSFMIFLAILFVFGLSTTILTGCGAETASFAEGEKLIDAQKRRAESFRGENAADRKPRRNRNRP